MVEIEWSPTAESDLYEILDYIAQDSPPYAVSLYEEVQEKVENLKHFPNIGRIVPELGEPNIRELILRNYRLIYRFLGEKIQIIRLIHGARLLRI